MSRGHARTLLLWFCLAVDASRGTSRRAGTIRHDVKLGVEVIQRGRFVALEVVPPITHEEPLVENGAVGAQERVVSAVFLTNVEDLALCVHVTVVPSILLLSAAESRAGNGTVDRVVLTGCSSDSWPGLAILAITAVVSAVLSIVMRSTANVLLTGVRTTMRTAVREAVW